MSIYNFPPVSPIREVIFRYAADRPPVALMTAADAAGIERLSIIRRAVEARGWQAVPVGMDGKEYMQVSGFEKQEDFMTFLNGYHFVEGQPKFTPEPGDHPTRTTMEWVQSVSLKGAGMLNMVGDITLLGSALMNKRSKEITAGALYTAGAAVLMRYGNVKTEHHLRQVIEKTGEFLNEQAGQLPEDCGLFTLLKQRREGVIPNAENFLYRYPAETMLTAYTLGAFTMMQSGIKQGNPWGIAYGASSLGFKAASLLIPEKKKVEGEKPPATPVSKFVNWVQEKPLRVFGFGSLVTDTLLGMSALWEFRDNPKQRGYILKLITSGTYMMADVLMAISNKNHNNADGKFDDDEQRRLVALVAEAIAREPENMREPLVQQVAGFLAMQPEVQGKAPDIAATIKEQLQHIQHNPWIRRTSGDASPPLMIN